MWGRHGRNGRKGLLLGWVGGWEEKRRRREDFILTDLRWMDGQTDESVGVRRVRMASSDYCELQIQPYQKITS